MKKEQTKDVELIGDDEAAILNKKVSEMVSCFFKSLADLSADEIYVMAYTLEGKESRRLLEVINNAFNSMIASGGDLPRLYFDSYKKTVTSFCDTLAFNLDSKLDDNRDLLLAKTVGKDNPDRISHQDIIDSLNK